MRKGGGGEQSACTGTQNKIHGVSNCRGSSPQVSPVVTLVIKSRNAKVWRTQTGRQTSQQVVAMRRARCQPPNRMQNVATTGYGGGVQSRAVNAVKVGPAARFNPASLFNLNATTAERTRPAEKQCQFQNVIPECVSLAPEAKTARWLAGKRPARSAAAHERRRGKWGKPKV